MEYGRGSPSVKDRNIPKEQDDGYIKINKISYNPNLELGKGAMGTAVFEGLFEEHRKIAVKRLLAENWSSVDREQALFLEADDHENVLRYYATESCTTNYCYIALELCEGTLEQLIENRIPKHSKLLQNNQEIDGLEILRQAMHGIAYLHNLDKPIVHRDLKPSNILIYLPKGASGPRGKIADLGLSKQLDPGRNSYTMSAARGTKGWMAPEILNQMEEMDNNEKFTATLKVDIFCSGMLVYYVKSNGKHPFDGQDPRGRLRDYNIGEGKFDLKDLDQKQDVIFIDLIKKMISFEPNDRPLMKVCLNHPAFWDKKQTLEFIRVASDYLKESGEVSQHVRSEIEKRSAVFSSSDWISEMDEVIQKDIRENRHAKYNGQRVEHILQAIRDYSHHFDKKSAEVRGTLVSHEDAHLVDHFLQKFPALLLHTYMALEPCKSYRSLATYYKV